MRGLLSLTACLGILSLASGSAEAAEPAGLGGAVITVAPLRGSGGAACARQLSSLLAAELRVEPWDDARGVAGFESFAALSRFIEARGKALGADIVIVGTARPKKLILEAYDVERAALLNLDRVPLSPKAAGCAPGRRGRARILRFAERALEAFARRRRVAAVARAPEPAESSTVADAAVQAPPEPTKADTAAAVEQTAKTTRRAAAGPFDGADTVLRDDLDAPRARRRTPEAPGEAEAEASAPRAPEPLSWVEVEPELGLSQRNLTFQNAAGTTVATYQVGAMFTPGLRARVRPLAARTGSFFERLTVELALRQSPTFDSRRVAGGPAVDTDYAEAFGMLRLPIAVPSTRFRVGPELGAHFLQYRLQGPSGGAAALDTPTVAYVGLLLGAGVEAKLVEQADVHVAAAYVPVLSGGQIFGANFYPDGSAWALRVEADLTVHVLAWLNIVVTGHYTGYSLGLRDDAPGEALATQATDRTTGLRLGVRLAL